MIYKVWLKDYEDNQICVHIMAKDDTEAEYFLCQKYFKPTDEVYYPTKLIIRWSRK